MFRSPLRKIVVGIFCISSLSVFSATLTINLSNVKSDKGTLQIRVADRALYESESKDPGKLNATAKPKRGDNTILIKDVPPGEYVVQVLHDLNGNEVMDYNFLNMPKEFWGISTNPKIRLDRELWEFDKIKIEVGKKDLTVDIRMRKLR